MGAGAADAGVEGVGVGGWVKGDRGRGMCAGKGVGVEMGVRGVRFCVDEGVGVGGVAAICRSPIRRISVSERCWGVGV